MILNTSVKSDDRVPTLINFRWSDYLNVPLRFYKTLVSITKAYHGLSKFPPPLLLQDNWLELVLTRSLEPFWLVELVVTSSNYCLLPPGRNWLPLGRRPLGAMSCLYLIPGHLRVGELSWMLVNSTQQRSIFDIGKLNLGPQFQLQVVLQP